MQFAHINMSINLSSKTLFSDINFRELETLLYSYDLNYTNITIEITETAVIHNIDFAIERINRLKKLGLKIALDDFGTGYSSLTYLKKLPIDCIKLDKSFIQSIEENNNDAHIIKFILQLSKSLNYGIVAEGIETKEQLKYLNKHNCECGQGFLMGRPVPIEDIMDMLNKGHRFSIKDYVSRSNKKINFIIIIILSIALFTIKSYARDLNFNYGEVFEEHGMVRMIIDVESGVIVQVNKAAVNFYGYSREELLNTEISDINTLTKEETEAEWRAAANGERNYFIFKHRLANGEVRDVEVHSYPLSHEGKEYLYSAIIDITSQVEVSNSLARSRRITIYMFLSILLLVIIIAILLYVSREKYKKFAIYDQLTGAYSRIYFNEWRLKNLKLQSNEIHNLSVIMIDVNKFKYINDNYGHIVGDRVLRKIVEILKICTRKDDIVVRYGGDEFLLILMNSTEVQAQSIMERVELKLKGIAEFNFIIEFSFGIENITDDMDILEAIKIADSKMYDMKSAG